LKGAIKKLVKVEFKFSKDSINKKSKKFCQFPSGVRKLKNHAKNVKIFKTKLMMRLQPVRE
ncbi:MAG: hypothetical protein AAFO67_08460, partial [Planctomycetota bacterium]